jgi:glucose-6-phosphate isomerase
MRTSSISTSIRKALKTLAAADKASGIKAKFDEDSNRVDRYSLAYTQFYIDMSKTHISNELISIYTRFAKEIDFDAKKEAFLAGQRINNSEDRSVLHALLRDTDNQGKTV